jgi:hypothetical protein
MCYCPFLWNIPGTGISPAFASFTVSEDSLRPLFFLSEAGMIHELHILLDHTVRRHKIDMLLFSSNITHQVRVTANHAKMLLISAPDWHISCVGSANLNKNARWESGILSTREEHHDAFLRGYKAAWEDAIPFYIDDPDRRPDTKDRAVCSGAIASI